MNSDPKKKHEEGEEFDLTLLSNFIHQVINPMNGVAGTLDNIIDGKITGAGRAEQRMRAARAQLEQCISLVRNLAYFAQGFSALVPTDARAVIVPQAIIEAAMFFQEDAANKGMTIELRNRRDQNKINGHPELIRQVFMPLFDNAVKYGVPDTTVTVRQKIQAKTGNVLITVTSTSREALVHEDLKRIFDLGFRGANAKKIIASGTGLGLFIVKKIVEEVHGGRIVAEASKKGGVKFIISLNRVI